jgi:hypothetical protein
MRRIWLWSLIAGMLPFGGVFGPAETVAQVAVNARPGTGNDAASCGPIIPSPTGLVISVNSFDSQHPSFNDLGGGYGPLNSDCISLSFDHDVTHDGSSASLKVAFTNLTGSFAGFWNSLIGGPAYPEYVLSVTNWDYLRFYVRGSGASSNVIVVKIEIKQSPTEDDPYSYSHTAYQYFQIDESNTNWVPIFFRNDLTDPGTWFFNQYPPDPTKIKEMVFVLEGYCNPDSGFFYVDDLAYLDSDAPAQPVTPLSSDQVFLAYLLSVNFRYFLHAVHPQTGLVLDRSSFSDLASIAGTGFGLGCWPLAAQFGLISRDTAFAFASNALTTLATAPMGSTQTGTVTSTGQIGVNGFFYHFLDSRTGTRSVQTDGGGAVVSGSELSSIDTAICVFGVLACRQAMTVTNGYTAQQASRIASLADTILGRIDWPFMLQTSGDQQMYLGWKPEFADDYEIRHPSGVGYISSSNGCERTCSYTSDEALLIAIAGMAAPDPAKRLPVTFMNSWQREKVSFAGYDVVMSYNGTAFTYQFANLWLPLDQMSPDGLGMDWWLNAYYAARCNYAFSMNSTVRAAYSTFDRKSFGPTACEDPSGRYYAFGCAPAGELTNRTSDAAIVREALAYFSPDSPDFVNGTLAPYGAACFIDFMPRETLAALRHYVFDLGLLHNYYGFSDSFHLNLSQYLSREREIESSVSNRLAAHAGIWRNPVQFSIDQGPIVLALGNYLHAGIVKDWVLSNPNVMRAVTNVFTSSTSDLCFVSRQMTTQDGGISCEMTWRASGFGVRYTVQESTNFLSGAWQDTQGPVVWPSRSRAWIAPAERTNALVAYRLITR